ncbi:MAG TPA: hypothetical protein VED01_03335 [Burkholderiales bacterium]|nr:hypothetical protein [Burkholderiales bacterium]
MGAAVNVLVLTPDELEAMLERAALRAISVRAAADVILSHEEAARQLGISPNALHKRVCKGQIVPDQRGGRDGFRTNGFTQSTLDAYKRKHSR